MQRIPAERFVDAINAIKSKNPKYKKLHDGSDGYCDEIGLIRGAVISCGATCIKGMKTIRQFVDETAVNVREIGDLRVGDIVLKISFGKYVSAGAVVSDSPVEIVYMTEKKVRKSKYIQSWDYVCNLPLVDNGRPIRMCVADAETRLYKEQSFGCKRYTLLEKGDSVSVMDEDGTWSLVERNGIRGYVLTKFLVDAEPSAVVLPLSDEDIERLNEAYRVIDEISNKLNVIEKRRRRWKRKRFGIF